MASAPEAIERFERESLFVTDPALTGRRLRERGHDLWPASGKGGGKNSPQVEPRHLTNFLLAQAAHLPADAAGAVAALLPLRLTDEDVLIQPEPGKAAPFMGAIAFFGRIGDTLGHVLHTHIAGAGDPEIRAALAPAIAPDWALTLCVDPAFATVTWRTGPKVETVVFGSRSHTGRARRLIELPFKVITICGELFEDTQRRNAARDGAALPVSHAHARDPLLDRMDSSSRVRVETTPSTLRGVHDYDRPGHGPAGTAGAGPA